MRGYADRFAERTVVATAGGSANAAAAVGAPDNGPPSGVDDVGKALDWWAATAAQTDAEVHRLELEGRTLKKAIAELVKARDIPSPSARAQNRHTASSLPALSGRKGGQSPKPLGRILITVDIQEIGGIELEVKYMTKGATWSPSYDLRVDTQTDSVSCTYYGMVSQSTNEDWKGAFHEHAVAWGLVRRLTNQRCAPAISPSGLPLPTRLPSSKPPLHLELCWLGLAMAPFALSPCDASCWLLHALMSEFYSTSMPHCTPLCTSTGIACAAQCHTGSLSILATCTSALRRCSSSPVYGGAYRPRHATYPGKQTCISETRTENSLAPRAPPPPPQAKASVAQVEGGGGGIGAVSFVVETPGDIKSNGETKKMTVGVLQLSAEVTHYIVPAKHPAAYLQAKATNNTEYLLLASNDVSIFFDNSFVTKTSLTSVSPGESFQTFLGIDPAVKITVASVRKTTKQRGIFSKSNQVTHIHSTSISNKKKVPVTCLVVDAMPRSTNEIIKVTLKQPVPGAVSESEAINDDVLASTALELFGGSEDEANGRQPPHSHTKTVVAGVMKNPSNHLAWVGKIAPQSEISIPLEYTMEWPSGKEIEIYE
ncbi:unnamed protein product [Scytosiphon promiscuus]